jgi:Fe-S cluster assembly scaffold protein SufB
LTAPAARPRPARRALDDLSLSVDETVLGAHATRDPDWLTADRRAAFAAWSSLPAETNLLYTPYIDLRAARLDTAALITVPDPDRPEGSEPAEAAAILEITDGAVTAAALSDEAAAAGVTLTDLRGLLASDPARTQRLLAEGPGLAEDDKFAQLTRAAWAQGAVVDVPDGIQLDRPIVIRWAIGAPDTALLTRTLVRIGAGGRASIVEEFVPSAVADIEAAQAFFAGTMEVVVGDGAALQVASLQELPGNIVAIQHRTSNVGEGASLQWALAQLGGRLVRSRVDNRLVGDRSSVEQVEIVFGADEQLFDLTSYTTHVGKHTTGDLLSKAALLEKSRTYLKGLITIERSANGTDSFLGEFGMNLSKSARSVAIPSLEIDQPDCRRAAHSSSVGPVDETQLFYLESRGIPPDEARKFIVLGFLEPVVARIPLGSAQDRLRELLEAKWIAGTDGIAGEAAA